MEVKKYSRLQKQSPGTIARALSSYSFATTVAIQELKQIHIWNSLQQES